MEAINLIQFKSILGVPFVQYRLGIAFFVLFLCGYSNEIADIEFANGYSWKKYMNEEEYSKIENGMSYIEVVRIVGGAGEKIATDTYEWPDELLLTKAYVLKFKNDGLVEKTVVEKKGHSTRTYDASQPR